MFDGMMDEYCGVHRVEGDCAQCKAAEELCIDEGCPHCGTAHVCITPEPKGPSVEQLREELILRNQEIEDLRLTNRNLSRKIVEYQRNAKGLHGTYPWRG
jgi:hypothetical protein